MAGDISLNFSSVPDYQPIPKGEYLVEVTEVEGPIQSSAGNAMLKLTYEIVEGEFAGRKIYNTFMLLEGDALWRTKRDLGVLMGSEIGDDVSFSAQDLVGSQAIAVLFPRVFKEEDGGDGESRPSIRKLKPAESAKSLFA